MKKIINELIDRMNKTEKSIKYRARGFLKNIIECLKSTSANLINIISNTAVKGKGYFIILSVPIAIIYLLAIYLGKSEGIMIQTLCFSTLYNLCLLIELLIILSIYYNYKSLCCWIYEKQLFIIFLSCLSFLILPIFWINFIKFDLLRASYFDIDSLFMLVFLYHPFILLYIASMFLEYKLFKNKIYEVILQKRQASSKDIKFIFVSYVYVIIFFSSIYYLLQMFWSNHQILGLEVYNADNYFKAMFNCFYFSTSTISTVGYGDVAPATVLSQFIVMIQFSIGLFLLVFSLGILMGNYQPNKNKQEIVNKAIYYYCTECGSKLKEKVMFCHTCGIKIG